MKQFVVDQLHPQETEKIRDALTGLFGEPAFDGVFWVPLDPEIMNPVQREHAGCHPLVFAVDVGEDRVSAELLIRTLSRMRCDCMGMADERQILFILDFFDRILREAGIGE